MKRCFSDQKWALLSQSKRVHYPECNTIFWYTYPTALICTEPYTDIHIHIYVTKNKINFAKRKYKECILYLLKLAITLYLVHIFGYDNIVVSSTGNFQ